MRELGMEPDSGTPEDLALFAEAGVAPRPAPGEPRGPDDERFSPIAIGHFTHRLVEGKRLLEQLNAEQKALHETLRLAHLRGDFLHLLAPSTEGWCYQLARGCSSTGGRATSKKWTYSPLWAWCEGAAKLGRPMSRPQETPLGVMELPSGSYKGRGGEDICSHESSLSC
jgi:hypothetical protein